VSGATGALQWLNHYADQAKPDANSSGAVRGGSGSQLRPWQYMPSIVWKDRVIAAPIDSDSLMVFEQSTGQLTSRIPFIDLRNPEAIVGLRDDRLYLCGASLVCFDLAANRVVWERQLLEGELFGQPALADDCIVVPRRTALLTYPLDGGAPHRFGWDLSSAGNVLIVSPHSASADSIDVQHTWPSQIVIASVRRIYGLVRK